MPVKRRIGKAFAHRITPEVVEAYRAGDYLRLHRALGLRPWERSPLPADLTPLGVGDGPPPSDRNAWNASWEQAKAIQEAILAEIGDTNA